MAAVGDFLPPDDDFIDEPINPVIFGIELSPTIIGELIAVVGLAGAGYLLVKMVQPVAERNTTLRTEISTKEGQLLSQKQQLEDIAKIEAELAVAMQRRRNVYSLFANSMCCSVLSGGASLVCIVRGLYLPCSARPFIDNNAMPMPMPMPQVSRSGGEVGVGAGGRSRATPARGVASGNVRIIANHAHAR